MLFTIYMSKRTVKERTYLRKNRRPIKKKLSLSLLLLETISALRRNSLLLRFSTRWPSHGTTPGKRSTQKCIMSLENKEKPLKELELH